MRKIFKNKLLLICFSFIFLLALARGAENQLSLTLAPSFFDLNLSPGESWKSVVKIVNPNPYDLVLYAATMNFEEQKDSVGRRFIPLVNFQESGGQSLANWIEINKEAIFVPREKSVELPFAVKVPKDAPAGGHSAAILIGLQPPDSHQGTTLTQTSGFVSSLIFVKVRGTIKEEGALARFSADKNFYQKPEVEFLLTFQNKGNTHLKPSGKVIIYNIWGQRRGELSLDAKDGSNIVLPQAEKDFRLSWEGENYLGSGRYKAVAAVTFGKEQLKTISRSTAFWVLPIKPILGIFIIFAIFIVLGIWAIKLYVNSLLEEAAFLGAKLRPVAVSKVKVSAPALRFNFGLVLILVLFLAPTFGVAARYAVERPDLTPVDNCAK